MRGPLIARLTAAMWFGSRAPEPSAGKARSLNSPDQCLHGSKFGCGDTVCAGWIARLPNEFALTMRRQLAVARESREHVCMPEVLRPGFHLLRTEIQGECVADEHVSK